MPGATAPVALDFLFYEPSASRVWVPAGGTGVVEVFDVARAKRIVPGQHDQSLLWLFSHRRDRYQVPPLLSHVIDELDNQAHAGWLDAPH